MSADRPQPDAGSLLAEFSARVLDKARKALRAGLVVPDSHYESVWWVGSLRPEQATPHRVSWGSDWITCSCAHGTKSGGGESRCYHVAAVLLLIQKRGTGQ